MKLDAVTLCNELTTITDWFSLGFNLGLQHYQLEEIRRNYFVDGISTCKRECLVLWLRCTSNASWGDVVQALHQMRENTEAERIKLKYIVASKYISWHQNISPLLCYHLHSNGVKGNQ